MKKDKRMLRNLRTSSSAMSIIVGTIVGVGIFGLPYAIAQTGFMIGLGMLILLSLAMLYLHFLYGEIVLRTRKKQRLAGYAKKYLGSRAKTVAALSVLFGLLGSQLAYLIVGGEFLQFIFHQRLGEDLFIYIIIFCIFGSLVVLRDSSLMPSFEFLMSLFLISVILLIFITALPKIELVNFRGFHPQNAFAAYGVILYSLSGVIAIPEAIEYLKRKRNKKIKNAVTIGTLLPYFLYFLFTLAVIGLLGKNVSESAIIGLSGVLGEKIIITGAIFGIVAVLTSFIIIGASLMKMLWYDYKVPKLIAWLVVSIVPVLLYLLGFKNFISVIAAVGAIMGGIDGIMIILIFNKIKRQQPKKKNIIGVNFPAFLRYGLITLFLLGILYEIYYFLSK